MRRLQLAALLGLVTTLGASIAQADPCGMVPPIRLPDNVVADSAIQRTGVQTTYVAFEDGIETMVLRPGFSGKVDEFGMLIPFPSAPAIRKTADNTFQHIAAAVDPPKAVIDLTPQIQVRRTSTARAPSMAVDTKKDGGLRYNEVRVLSQEAVGMYEVAVLQAGSSAALDRWMAEHAFKYPTGMDNVVDDYVKLSWVFVAIKTRVGQMPGVTPKPGMRGVKHSLPPGSSFDGHVQGMGFRFQSDELVVPMRLSTFNGPDTHNLVYVLTKGAVKIAGVDGAHVRRQIDGAIVHHNVTSQLPIEVRGGTLRDVDPSWLGSISSTLSPTRFNGHAKDLFGGDLLALQTGQLQLPYEQKEKDLLNISEELGMRGTAVDELMNKKVELDKDATAERALSRLRELTLTVIDGDLPREHLRDRNITFSAWNMPVQKNKQASYDARTNGPGPVQAAPYLYGVHRR